MKELYWGIAISLLVGILALIKGWKSKKDSSFKKENIIAVLGFILLLGGLYLTYKSGNSAITENKNNKKKADQRQHRIDSLQTELLQKQDSLQAKSNTIISLQNKVQAKTDQIVKSQEKIIVDYERGLNPLFPIDILNIKIKFPFDGNQIRSKELFAFKELIESRDNNENKNINITWSKDLKEVAKIGFIDKHISLGRFGKGLFFTMKRIDIRLQKKEEVQTNSHDLLFSGQVFFEPMSKQETNNAYISVDFDLETIEVNLTFRSFWLSEPNRNIPIGTFDFLNNYLVIAPKDLCNYEILYLTIQKMNPPFGTSLSISFTNSDIRTNNQCYYYIHKINPDEIRTYRQALKRK